MYWMYVPYRLKKVNQDEKKEEKPDAMSDMMARIRSGNVQLKKVQGSPKPVKKETDVMSEMAKLLVIFMECVLIILSLFHD